MILMTSHSHSSSSSSPPMILRSEFLNDQNENMNYINDVSQNRNTFFDVDDDDDDDESYEEEDEEEDEEDEGEYYDDDDQLDFENVPQSTNPELSNNASGVQVNVAFQKSGIAARTRALCSLKDVDVENLQVDDQFVESLLRKDFTEDNFLSMEYSDDEDDEYTPRTFMENPHRSTYATRRNVSYADKNLDELGVDDRMLDRLMAEIEEDNQEPDFEKELYQNFLRGALNLPDPNEARRKRRKILDSHAQSESNNKEFPFRVRTCGKLCELLQNMVQIAFQIHKRSRSEKCGQILNTFGGANQAPTNSFFRVTNAVRYEDFEHKDPHFSFLANAKKNPNAKVKFLASEDLLLERGLHRFSWHCLEEITQWFFPGKGIHEVGNRYRNQSARSQTPNIIKSYRIRMEEDRYPVLLKDLQKQRLAQGIMKYGQNFTKIVDSFLPEMQPKTLQLYYVAVVSIKNIASAPILERYEVDWSPEEDKRLLLEYYKHKDDWTEINRQLNKPKCKKKDVKIRYQDLMVCYHLAA